MTLRFMLLRPDVVFAARVNMSAINYPLDRVTYDTVTTGAYTDIQPEMTVLFGSAAGQDDLGRQRVRKAPTSDTLYIGRSSIGAHDGEVNLTDDCYITVYNEYRIWAKIPFINTDGEVFKDSDLLVGEKTILNWPKANAGPPAIGYATGALGSEVCRFTLPIDPRASFAVADGATIDTYAWDLPDGCTAVGPTDGATVTFDAEPGYYYVALTVTDSNGKSHTARALVVSIGGGIAQYDPRIEHYSIDSWRVTPDGQEISLRVKDPIPLSTYPDGAVALLWEDNPDASTTLRFSGYMHQEPFEIVSADKATLKDTTLTLHDVAARLRTIPGFPLMVENKTGDETPQHWHKMHAATLDKYLDYLLRWHSNVLDLADFSWPATGSDYAFVALGSDGATLWEQVNLRAQAYIPSRRLTCTREGRLQVPLDPMTQESGQVPNQSELRTSTVQATLTDDDWTSLSAPYSRTPKQHWHRGNAVVSGYDADIGTVFCVAPGSAPGQGPDEDERGAQLAKSANAQTDLNISEGHRYARLQAREGHYQIALVGGQELELEPADLTWLSVQAPAAVAAQRGWSFAEARGLVEALDIAVASDGKGTLRTFNLEWERETWGPPAETYIPPPGDNLGYNWGGWGIQPDPVATHLPADTVCLIANNTHGNTVIHATTNFTAAGSCVWVSTTLPIQGALDAVFDPFSPAFLGTGAELNGWVVTQRYIYRLENLLGGLEGYPGSPSATLEYTFASYDLLQKRIMAVSAGDFWGDGSAWVGVASVYGAPGGALTLKFVGHTGIDGGDWGSEVTVRSVGSSSNGMDAYPSLALSLDAGIAVMGAPDTSRQEADYHLASCDDYCVPVDCSPDTSTQTGVYTTYLATTADWGATWSSPPASATPGIGNMVGTLGGGLHYAAGGGAVRVGGLVAKSQGISRPATGCCLTGQGVANYYTPYIACYGIDGLSGIFEEDPTALLVDPTTGDTVVSFGPRRKKFALASLSSNPDFMVMCGWGSAGYFTSSGNCGIHSPVQEYLSQGLIAPVTPHYRLMYSDDGGTTWTDLSTGSGPLLEGARGYVEGGDSYPQEVAFGTEPDVLYVWGTNFVGYNNNYTEWKDCRGNVPSPGEIVSIAAVTA